MAELSFEEDRLELFPTAIFKRHYQGLEGVNGTLRELILERESASQSLTKSNVGGFHSTTDLLNWDSPAIVVLKELLRDAVHQYVAAQSDRDPKTMSMRLALEGWANVSREGNYARPHVHPSASLGISYYVDAGRVPEPPPGQPPVEGCIEFLDPRNRPNMFETPGIEVSDTVTIRPRAGLLLVFPAWLYHYVHPYFGKEPRISIAANATILEVTGGKQGARP